MNILFVSISICEIYYILLTMAQKGKREVHWFGGTVFLKLKNKNLKIQGHETCIGSNQPKWKQNVFMCSKWLVCGAQNYIYIYIYIGEWSKDDQFLWGPNADQLF